MASFVRAHKFRFVIFVLVYTGIQYAHSKILAEFGINIFNAFELSNCYMLKCHLNCHVLGDMKSVNEIEFHTKCCHSYLNGYRMW